MLKDQLISFKKKKKKFLNKGNQIILSTGMKRINRRLSYHLAIFKNAWHISYNITNDIYWPGPPWYLIIMRHLLRHNTYLIGGYEQLPTRRTNHGGSPEILLYPRHPWRAPVPIRNIYRTRILDQDFSRKESPYWLLDSDLFDRQPVISFRWWWWCN